MPRIVYSRRYNIGFLGLERLHPFDSRKYGRAWRCLRRHFGRSLHELWVRPPRAVARAELLQVHTPGYLDQLRDSAYVARALELPPVGYMPGWLVDRCVLKPMRWATMGTIIATQQACEHGLAINLGGGFHHAKPNGGEGFSIYNDIAVAVHTVRRSGLLGGQQRVVYIDLDAHQGNGVSHAFRYDNLVFLFDMFNSLIYPAYDHEARERIDCSIALTSFCHEREYLQELRKRLPKFLDSVGHNQPIGLALYNAGTDVYRDDPLGGLSLSADAIRDRDCFVIQELRQRNISTAMVLGGGYTPISYQLVANSVIELLSSRSGL